MIESIVLFVLRTDGLAMHATDERIMCLCGDRCREVPEVFIIIGEAMVRMDENSVVRDAFGRAFVLA